MSEFKGTKGKWDIDSSSDSRVELVGGLIDVWIYGKSGDIDIVEAKANAQLISKAPEMLEMLKKVLDTLSPEFPDKNQALIISEIEQLIKEATTI